MMKLRNSPKIELKVLNIRTAPVGSQIPHIIPNAIAIKIFGNNPNRFIFFNLSFLFANILKISLSNKAFCRKWCIFAQNYWLSQIVS